jgi:hypothetical protein
MKPLLCPQCGGSIANYSERDRFATCRYCSTRFLIESAAEAEDNDQQPGFITEPGPARDPQTIFIAVGIAALLCGSLIIFALVIAVDNPEPKQTGYSTPTTSFTFSGSSPTP